MLSEFVIWNLMMSKNLNQIEMEFVVGRNLFPDVSREMLSCQDVKSNVIRRRRRRWWLLSAAVEGDVSAAAAADEYKLVFIKKKIIIFIEEMTLMLNSIRCRWRVLLGSPLRFASSGEWVGESAIHQWVRCPPDMKNGLQDIEVHWFL